MAYPLTSPALQLLDKLETFVNRWYERGDVIQDNKEQLLRLTRDYEMTRELLRKLSPTSTQDHVTITMLRRHERILQEDEHNLASWENSIEQGTRTDRVKRMKEILGRCEEHLKEFLKFLSDRIPSKSEHPLQGACHLLHPFPLQQDAYVPNITVPPNPPRLILDYDSAATCEGKLKAAVVSDENRRIVAVIATGKGGVGKTCALRGLADDIEIQHKFPGGILYIQLGNNIAVNDIVNGIANIVERTGGMNLAKAIRGGELQVAAEKASDWFRTQSCLFLVDDIWRVNRIDCDVLTILATMVRRNSRLVYTTRDRRFLDRADKEIMFSEKEPYGELSRRMLMTHAGFSEDCILEGKNKEAFEHILNVCQGLPLAFGIGGSSVLKISRQKREERKQDAWSDFQRDISSTPDKFFEGSAVDYGPLSKIVDVSLKALEKENELEYFKLFRSFCVLQKQQRVPVDVLRRLWNFGNVEDAKQVVFRFEDVSIIEVEREYDTYYVRLHDLVLDVAVRNASERSESQEFFQTLCNNYFSIGERNGAGHDWWNLADDGYIQSNLCRILRSAGYLDELLWLLSKPQWITKRLVDGGIYSVEQDVRHGEQVARDQSCGRFARKQHLEIVRRAARMCSSVVANNPREVWFQLYGRLLWHANQCNLTRRFVEEIEECAPRPWAKASLGLLQPPGAAVEMIPSPGKVRCISVEPDEIWFFWTNYRQSQLVQMGVTSYEIVTGDYKTQRFVFDLIDDIDCCAFLQERKRVVTAHRSLWIGIWNRETGEIEQIIGCVYKPSHVAMLSPFAVPGDERFMEFRSDGRRVASVSSDHTVQVWDTLRGEPVGKPLVGHTEMVLCVAMSAKGNRIVSGSKDCTVRVWDLHYGTLVETLSGHIDSVWCVALSADSTRVVSGSWDKTVRFWDVPLVPNGKAISASLKIVTESVQCLAVSGDGRRVVSASSLTNALKVWDADSGAAITQPLMGHTSRIESINVSTDGLRLVSGSEDKTVRVWDAHDKVTVPKPLVDHHIRITCAALGANGKLIALGSLDGKVRLGDARNGEIRDLVGHRGSVVCVAVSADGNYVVSGSRDNTVRVWDAGAKKIVANWVIDHASWIRSIAVSCYGERVVLGSLDGTIRAWDVPTGKELIPPLYGHTASVLCVALSTNGKKAVSGSADNAVRLWDMKTGNEAIPPLVGHTDLVLCVAISADGNRIVSGSRDSTMRVWDVQQPQKHDVLARHNGKVLCVAISADGKLAVSGSSDEAVYLWNLQHTGREVHITQIVCKITNGSVLCVALSAGGSPIKLETHLLSKKVRPWNSNSAYPSGSWYRNRIVAVSGDHTLLDSNGNLCVWDVRSCKLGTSSLRIHYPHYPHYRYVFLMSMDGKRIFSVERSAPPRQVCIWDVSAGKCQRLLLPFDNKYYCICGISVDGSHIALASPQGYVCVWDTQSGTKDTRFLRRPEILCIAISANGKRIVTGCRDNTVRVHDVHCGDQVAQPLIRHNDRILSVAVSADGNVIVSGSKDDTVRVWTAQIGAEAIIIRTRNPLYVALSADEKRIVSCSRDGTEHVWEVRLKRADIQGSSETYSCVTQSADDKLMVTTFNCETGVLRDPHEWEPTIKSTIAHTGSVKCVAMSTDSNLIVSGSRDKTVCLWDAHSGEHVAPPLVGHDHWVTCVAISADGNFIVSGSLDGTVLVWDTQSREVVGAHRGHTGSVVCVAVSASGNDIVSGSRDKTLCVWNPDSGMQLQLQGHTADVSCVAISANGECFVSGSADKAVCVWNRHGGEEPTLRLVGHTEDVSCVAMSADGKRIASGSNDRTVRVWDAQSGEAIGNPLTHDGCVKHVAVDAHCSNIVSVDENGLGRLWDLRRGQCELTTRDAAWRARVGALQLSRPYECWLTGLSNAQVRDGEQVLATCEGAVQNVGFGDVFFTRDFGARCRIVRDAWAGARARPGDDDAPGGVHASPALLGARRALECEEERTLDAREADGGRDTRAGGDVGDGPDGVGERALGAQEASQGSGEAARRQRQRHAGGSFWRKLFRCGKLQS